MALIQIQTMMTRLTAEEYDRIPCPGSATYKVPDTKTMLNAQSHAYKLAMRRNERVVVNTDQKTMTVTINKLGAR